MRWLAIDHGLKHVGVAVGDMVTRQAGPLERISGQEEDNLIARIDALAQEYGVDGIVVGWPLNADGTEGPQGRLARQFAARLAQRTGRDVRMWDERLSSFVADQRLRGRFTRKKKKQRQDAVAAASFLEDFLARDGPTAAPRPESAVPPEPHEAE